MTQYRVYSIDPQGRISGDRVIEAASDDEAIFAVRSMQRELNTEVWHGDRRVGRIAGIPKVTSRAGSAE